MPVATLRATLGSYLPWALLAVGAAVVWTFWPKPTPEVGKSVPLPPAKEVKGVERIIERVEYIKVYPDAIKAKVKLPEPILKDSSVKLISTGKLDAEERPYTLSAVLNTGTGEAEVYARPDPLPWVSVSKKRHFSGYMGVMNGEQAVAITARQEVLRIKELKIEGVAIMAASNDDRYSFIGVGATW